MELLDGQCYHMATVSQERLDHHDHWRKALKGQARLVKFYMKTIINSTFTCAPK